jgi:hypothetical protein
MGDIAARLLGRVSELGNIIGDVNSGHFALDIRARLSTISKVPGQGRLSG